MSMTLDEFFEKLAEIKENIIWEIEKDGKIRGQAPARVCPITATCYNVTGTLHKVFFWVPAAEVIGLSFDKAEKIAKAADNQGQEKLRTKLIETLQL